MSPSPLFLRQVHPDFIPAGKLTSQAFMPFPKDAGKLSVYDGSRIDPAEAYMHYTKVLHYESHSVWGVTGEEVAGAGLATSPDPLKDFPEHAVIDFTSHAEKEYRKLAKLLKASALRRGCLYSPPD